MDYNRIVAVFCNGSFCMSATICYEIGLKNMALRANDILYNIVDLRFFAV